MKQQKMIVVAVTLILALCIAAVAWPWGNVGLNVSEPEAQLDVGGDVLVRSNLVVRNNTIQIGEENYGYEGRIRVYNGSEGRFDVFGQVVESSFCFGVEGGPYYGFGMDGRVGGGGGLPWYGDEEGPEWGHENYGASTNRASIRVTYNPPGFIFNVNGVIWTNTP